MADPLTNIYSPENIARSRQRAAAFRRMADGANPNDRAEYLAAAESIEEYAIEREQATNHTNGSGA
jgi:hypothetical protein